MIGKRARALFVLLAAVLVLGQALALMHRVAHAPLAPAGAAPLAAGDIPTVAVQASSDPDDRGWLAAMFAHQSGDPDCLVLDALGHAGLANPPALQVPALLPPFLLAFQAGECLARWAAFFDARGPPASL